MVSPFSFSSSCVSFFSLFPVPSSFYFLLVFCWLDCIKFGTRAFCDYFPSTVMGSYTPQASCTLFKAWNHPSSSTTKSIALCHCTSPSEMHRHPTPKYLIDNHHTTPIHHPIQIEKKKKTAWNLIATVSTHRSQPHPEPQSTINILQPTISPNHHCHQKKPNLKSWAFDKPMPEWIFRTCPLITVAVMIPFC